MHLLFQLEFKLNLLRLQYQSISNELRRRQQHLEEMHFATKGGTHG
jgi:hypothetical protein